MQGHVTFFRDLDPHSLAAGLKTNARLREEGSHPGENVCQLILTCRRTDANRISISEQQSYRIALRSPTPCSKNLLTIIFHVLSIESPPPTRMHTHRRSNNDATESNADGAASGKFLCGISIDMSAMLRCSIIVHPSMFISPLRQHCSDAIC